MTDIVDITSILSIPAFAVLIWQQVQTNNQLREANARYERLVSVLIEGLRKAGVDLTGQA